MNYSDHLCNLAETKINSSNTISSSINFQNKTTFDEFALTWTQNNKNERVRLFIYLVWCYLADEDFVGVRAVDVGGVEESDAGGDGVVDKLYHVLFGFRWAVHVRHAHTAQSLGRHLHALRAQQYSTHCGHFRFDLLQSSLPLSLQKTGRAVECSDGACGNLWTP